ncbi:Acyl carrier protein 1, mitochondrial [Entophlyctis sp. JEL0112]|nr:Acyl carrier protein 1, mitochondrial [Entophlyctis sp. JEL0112]KAJ3384035.1 Acyl carrier protein 1, mitochondrial [Entophlyctis sp. JEL0112]
MFYRIASSVSTARPVFTRAVTRRSAFTHGVRLPAAVLVGTSISRPRFYSAGPEPLTKERIQERVLNVLRDFDKVDVSKLTLDSHFITDLGLDSLDQVEITIAVEEEFNIELSDRDADDILTPRAAAEKVYANKAAM